MDVEKLIRRLRNDADAYRNGETLGRAFADQEDVLDNAATALSTLQAENEKLRAELEQVKQDRDAAVKDIELIVRRINDCNIKLDDGTTVSSLELGRCRVCKHEETGDCDDGECIFEWRGPKKEN